MESYEQSKALINPSFWPTSLNQIDDETRKPNYNINTNGKRVYVDDNLVYPPGYRFCPHDQELIVHYLRKKVLNEVLPHNKIKEVNLYKHTPQELSENYPMVGEKEWYFFTPRNRKYPNGDRPNRAAGTGYWKATGADKPIIHNNVKIGFRKALVFYQGKPPKGDKTNWIMHEFRVNESRLHKEHASDMRLDDWVLCRIYKKIGKSSSKAPRKEEQAVGKVEVQNGDYEGNMYSYATQPFQLSLPHHMTDPNLYSLDNLSDYEMNLSDPNIFPMNFDVNLLDPYEIMGAIESQNVLIGAIESQNVLMGAIKSQDVRNIDDPDENSSSEEED